MDRPVQLLLPQEIPEDEGVLCPENEGEVVNSMARLLLFVLAAEERKEGQNDTSTP